MRVSALFRRAPSLPGEEGAFCIFRDYFTTILQAVHAEILKIFSARAYGARGRIDILFGRVRAKK